MDEWMCVWACSEVQLVWDQSYLSWCCILTNEWTCWLVPWPEENHTWLEALLTMWSALLSAASRKTECEKQHRLLIFPFFLTYIYLHVVLYKTFFLKRKQCDSYYSKPKWKDFQSKGRHFYIYCDLQYNQCVLKIDENPSTIQDEIIQDFCVCCNLGYTGNQMFKYFPIFPLTVIAPASSISRLFSCSISINFTVTVLEGRKNGLQAVSKLL